MANLDQAPSRSMPNLLHVLPAFADEAELRLNTIVELNSNTINKYELITETGHLKLDRVGYSSLAYPFAYGCIPAPGMKTATSTSKSSTSPSHWFPAPSLKLASSA